MVSSPRLISHDVFNLGEETVEEIFILIAGSIGFLLYMIREKQIEKENQERTKFQREVNRMSKDLKNSYSYIGEINRKLDIFKNIALGLPEWSKLTPSKEKEIFKYIMAAVKILTKAEEYKICFVDIFSEKTIKEIANKKNAKFDCSIQKYLKNRKFFETNKYMVFVSPESMDNILSVVILKKKNPAHSVEDPEILKAIASQALFLFVVSQKKKKKNKI